MGQVMSLCLCPSDSTLGPHPRPRPPRKTTDRLGGSSLGPTVAEMLAACIIRGWADTERLQTETERLGVAACHSLLLLLRYCSRYCSCYIQLLYSCHHRSVLWKKY
jgi:hypothetical protein